VSAVVANGRARVAMEMFARTFEDGPSVLRECPLYTEEGPGSFLATAFLNSAGIRIARDTGGSSSMVAAFMWQDNAGGVTINRETVSLHGLFDEPRCQEENLSCMDTVSTAAVVHGLVL
jgi:hypothetical protein